MNRFSRTVLGYHGCQREFATSLLNGTRTLDDWTESANPYDWLGRGIYFWEHAPNRAWRWARENAARRGGQPDVIGAVINLGRCFDLTDLRFAERLGDTYEFLRETGLQTLPVNSGTDADLKNRRLDCLVINTCMDLQEHENFQTVRSPFTEGGPAYPGAKFMKESHIQVAVRDRACILGVFRPTLRA